MKTYLSHILLKHTLIKTTLQNIVELSSIYVYTLEKFSNGGEEDIFRSVVHNCGKLQTTQKFINMKIDIRSVIHKYWTAMKMSELQLHGST